MKAQLQAVEIEWMDSATISGWNRPSEYTQLSGLSPCVSVGYLTKYTRTEVQIVQSRHDLVKAPGTSDWYGEGLSIPRSCVKKVRTLK